MVLLQSVKKNKWQTLTTLLGAGLSYKNHDQIVDAANSTSVSYSLEVVKSIDVSD